MLFWLAVFFLSEIEKKCFLLVWLYIISHNNNIMHIVISCDNCELKVHRGNVISFAVFNHFGSIIL